MASILPLLVPFPGEAVVAAGAPHRQPGTTIDIPDTDCQLKYVKYSALSVAITVGCPALLNNTESGGALSVAASMGGHSTDISLSGVERHAGMFLNTCAQGAQATTGGYGWILSKGKLRELNAALGTTFKAKTTASMAQDAAMNVVADGKYAACSTGTKGTSTAVAICESATANSGSHEDVYIVGWHARR